MNQNINNKTYKKWILEGYKYFARTGPQKFSIKELSEISGLSRTSFNYYFDNKDFFFDRLIKHHLLVVAKFGEEAIKNKENTLEGISKTMEKHKTGMLFHIQLSNNRNIEKFHDAFYQGHKMNLCSGILDWFIKYFNLKTSKENEKRIFLLFIDILNTRFNQSLQDVNNTLSFSSVFLDVINDFKLLLESYSKE